MGALSLKWCCLSLGVVVLTLLAACYAAAKPQVARYGLVLGVRQDKIEEYKKLHAAVWPEVLKMIKASHIQNYSIFLRKLPDGQHYLFSYFEYTGSDFDADMARMTADPITQKWWDVCKPCQVPFPDRAEGEWWTQAEEVFHQD